MKTITDFRRVFFSYSGLTDRLEVTVPKEMKPGKLQDYIDTQKETKRDAAKILSLGIGSFIVGLFLFGFFLEGEGPSSTLQMTVVMVGVLLYILGAGAMCMGAGVAKTAYDMKKFLAGQGRKIPFKDLAETHTYARLDALRPLEVAYNATARVDSNLSNYAALTPERDKAVEMFFSLLDFTLNFPYCENEDEKTAAEKIVDEGRDLLIELSKYSNKKKAIAEGYGLNTPGFQAAVEAVEAFGIKLETPVSGKSNGAHAHHRSWDRKPLQKAKVLELV